MGSYGVMGMNEVRLFPSADGVARAWGLLLAPFWAAGFFSFSFSRRSRRNCSLFIVGIVGSVVGVQSSVKRDSRLSMQKCRLQFPRGVNLSSVLAPQASTTAG